MNRNTKEQYWDYVKRLAAENGIDPEDSAAVRKFDRNRPGKGSNQEWQNPHDPDAKIGRTKNGATDMIYKPEAVVDVDTDAIVAANVHPGDQAEHKLSVTSVSSDKGYYAVGELHKVEPATLVGKTSPSSAASLACVSSA